VELYVSKQTRIVTKTGAVDTFELQLRSARGWQNYSWATRLSALFRCTLVRALCHMPSAPDSITLEQLDRVVDRAAQELSFLAARSIDETEAVRVETSSTKVTGDMFDDV
jgi:hypothetical protein